MNLYLYIKYGSIQEYETNCAKEVPKNIPEIPINLSKIIEKTILDIAAINGVTFPFSNIPIVTLYVYAGVLMPQTKKLNAKENGIICGNIYSSPNHIPIKGFKKIINDIEKKAYIQKLTNVS